MKKTREAARKIKQKSNQGILSFNDKIKIVGIGFGISDQKIQNLNCFLFLIFPYLFTIRMGKGYKRFKKEIIRSHDAGATLFIIVEGTLSEVGRGFKHSTMSPSSVTMKLYTLWIRHGIQTIFCESREEMVEYITNFYVACGREHVRKRERG